MTIQNYSLNIIVQKLKKFADEHRLIRRVTFGDPAVMDIGMNKDEIGYPVFHIEPVSCSRTRSEKAFRIQIHVMDIPGTKEDKTLRQIEIESDCSQIVDDLFAEARKSTGIFGETLSVEELTDEYITEREGNQLTGVVFACEFRVDWSPDWCEIPAEFVG